MFTEIVNLGIDLKLQAFVKSKFFYKEQRLIIKFHTDELDILFYRLDFFANNPNEKLYDTLGDPYFYLIDWKENIEGYS